MSVMIYVRYEKLCLKFPREVQKWGEKIESIFLHQSNHDSGFYNCYITVLECYLHFSIMIDFSSILEYSDFVDIVRVETWDESVLADFDFSAINGCSDLRFVLWSWRIWIFGWLLKFLQILIGLLILPKKDKIIIICVCFTRSSYKLCQQIMKL